MLATVLFQADDTRFLDLKALIGVEMQNLTLAAKKNQTFKIGVGKPSKLECT